MSNGLFYSMGLDPRQFIGGLDQAKNALGGMSSPIGSLTKLVGGLTTAFAGLGAAAVAINALKDAADFEKISTGLNTILKSTAATSALVRQLAELGAQTPLELPDLAQGARSLLAAGAAANTVTDELRMLGDVAAAADAPLQQIVDLYAKARGAGKVQGDIFQSFNAMGIGKPIKQAIADMKGLPVGLLEDMASKGEISFSDLSRAIRKSTADGGMFFNAMKDQSTTTWGLISTLKDNFNALLRVFASPTNDALKPMLQGAITKLDQLRGSAEVYVSAIGIAFKNGKLGDFLYNSLAMGFGKAVNYGYAQFIGLRNAIGGFNLIGSLTNSNIWQGIAMMGKSAMLTIVGGFQNALYDMWDNFVSGMGYVMRDSLGIGKTSSAARASAASNMAGGADVLFKGENGRQTIMSPMEAGVALIKAGMGQAASDFKNGAEGAAENFARGVKIAGKLVNDKQFEQNNAGLMNFARLQGVVAAQNDKKALDAQGKGLQAQTQPLLDQFLAKILGGAAGAGGGAGGGVGAGIGGAAAAGATKRLNPLQEAARAFTRLSSSEFDKFNTDPFANNGKGAKFNTEDTFQRFLKSRPDLKNRVAAFGKKFNLNPDALSLGEGLSQLPASMLPKVPKAALPENRFQQGNNGKRELSTVEKILQSISQNTEALRGLKVK